jgi:hypothetical protein
MTKCDRSPDAGWLLGLLLFLILYGWACYRTHREHDFHVHASVPTIELMIDDSPAELGDS